MIDESPDVLIIGAGPSGTTAAALLLKEGFSVHIVESQKFPRFVIGESLLPQCMDILEEADLLTCVEEAGFQRKNGAKFLAHEGETDFSFSEQFTEGWSYTYQVKRDVFDKALADEVERRGAIIHYECRVVEFISDEDNPKVFVKTKDEDTLAIQPRFILDASGYGRVLAGLEDLEVPSDFPTRASVFSQFDLGDNENLFDQDKITVSVHPENQEIWYWLIPFSDNSISVGIIAEEKFFEGDKALSDIYKDRLIESALFSEWISTANMKFDPKMIKGYSKGIKQLHGKGYAILGNAGEFVDPVFSSGVVVALKSAKLATNVLVKELNGASYDWNVEYSEPLLEGVQVFKSFVNAWYDGRFKEIIFHENQPKAIKDRICSVLAGYVWDKTNKYVRDSEQGINTLIEICRIEKNQNG